MADQVKVENLRRFTRQWDDYSQEIQDELNVSEFNESDADYAMTVLYGNDDTLDKYNQFAMEV